MTTATNLAHKRKLDTITSMAREEYIQVRVTSSMKSNIARVAEQRGMTISGLLMLALTQQFPELIQVQQAAPNLGQTMGADYQREQQSLKSKIHEAIEGFDEEASK